MSKFHIGTILSVTHDTLLAPDGIGDCYRILNYMTGEELFTHQLPRVAREARPVILAAHPWLADIDVSHINSENWREEVAKIVAEHGEYHAVPKLNADQHERIDPLSELAEKVPPDKIIVVKP